MSDRGGRPMFAVSRDRPDGPVLALDLGASRIRAAVVTPEGVVVARSHAATPGSAGPEAVVAACIGQLRLVAQEAGDTQRSRPVAIGIAAPGPVDTVRGVIIEPPNVGPGFRNVDLAGAVADALDLPAVLERDTNVAALGEQAFGAARGTRDFLYITVSTGIGGAIVARGELYGGADGMAGEIGHLPVAVDGPPCGCGARGHLEATSSGSGIARIAAARIANGDARGLAQIAARSGRALDAHAVADAEDDGDRDAAEIMEFARAAFAAATVGLVDVFNPELIVVGGSLARGQGERWLRPAREAVASTAFSVPARRVRIVPAALGDDVGLVGAVPLVARRILPA